MTSNTPDSVDSVTSATIADGARLIATFYGSDELASSLEEGIKNLNRAPEGTTILSARQSTVGDPPLYVEGPQTPNTRCIQLALETPGNTTAAFEAMSRKLKYMLDLTDLPDRWLGYTLIYQGVLAPEADADRALDELRVVKLLDPSESLYKLAQADMSGGTVRLLDIPNQGDGLQAATVYVAISRSDSRKAFESEVLYGKGATLLMPDLIAHESYQQTREYSSDDIPRKYQDRVEVIQQTTDNLLEKMENRSEMETLLNELARAYEPLIRSISYLKSLHVSLERHLHNYASWKGNFENNEVIDYHYGYLKRKARELELMVAEGQDVLEMADRATSMAQVQINEAQGRNQHLIQTLLAVVAAALAIPQMIDQNVASALLELLLSPLHIPEPADGFNALILLVTQVVIIVILVLLLRPVVRWWFRKQREG